MMRSLMLSCPYSSHVSYDRFNINSCIITHNYITHMSVWPSAWFPEVILTPVVSNQVLRCATLDPTRGVCLSLATVWSKHYISWLNHVTPHVCMCYLNPHVRACHSICSMTPTERWSHWYNTNSDDTRRARLSHTYYTPPPATDSFMCAPITVRHHHAWLVLLSILSVLVGCII